MFMLMHIRLPLITQKFVDIWESLPGRQAVEPNEHSINGKLEEQMAAEQCPLWPQCLPNKDSTKTLTNEPSELA